MEITEVRVFPVNEDKLKAYATITFDDCFVIRDLKVIHGNSGLFVAMPSKNAKTVVLKTSLIPLNNEFRSKIEQKVLDAYEAERAQMTGPREGPAPKAPESPEPPEPEPSPDPEETLPNPTEN